METGIEVVRGDQVVASTVIDGVVLPFDVPEGVSVRDTRTRGERVVEVSWPAGRDYAGRLAVPYVGESGDERMVHLDVPSSGHFTAGDFKVMWPAAAELARWREGRQAIPAGGTDAFAGARLDVESATLAWAWQAVARCAGVAVGLLSAWPQDDRSSTVWVPVGIHRGVEDLHGTEQAIEHPAAQARRVDGRIRVRRSLRREGGTVGWESMRVTLAGRRLEDAAGRLLGRFAHVPTVEKEPVVAAMEPIREVTLDAAPLGGTPPEQDLSSLPHGFRQFITEASIASSQLLAASGAGDFLPLLSVDELYEQWLAVALRQSLTVILGATPDTEDADRGLLGRWNTPGRRVDLWVQPSIPAAGRIDLDGVELAAALGERLVPDALLAVHRPDGVRVAVYDAKAYREFGAGDITVEASKYLWSIREAGVPDQPGAIDHVVLATSASTRAAMSSSRPWLGRALARRIEPRLHTERDDDTPLRSSVARTLDELARPAEPGGPSTLLGRR